MFKHIYSFFILLVLIFGFQSCIDSTDVSLPVELADPLTEPTPEELSDYIVVFKDAPFAGLSSFVNSDNFELAQDVFEYEYEKIISNVISRNTQVDQVYLNTLKGCSLSMTQSEYKNLAKDSRVTYIEKDQIINLEGMTTSAACANNEGEIVPCGVALLGNGQTYVGTNKAFILDTGIDLDHPDLNISKKLKYNAYKKRNGASPMDGHGHGTHVAGTIGAIANNGIGVVGVAAGVELVAVRVLDDNGTGSISGVIAGVDYVGSKGRSGDVANLSLGSSISPTLDDAIFEASQKGIWFVIAAGNSATDSKFSSPARLNGQYVLTIAAMTCSADFAFFSNYGSTTVDYVAPGVSICSTYLNGEYISFSGTSMAAPHATGAVLMSKGNPKSCRSVYSQKDGVTYPEICF